MDLGLGLAIFGVSFSLAVGIYVIVPALLEREEKLGFTDALILLAICELPLFMLLILKN